MCEPGYWFANLHPAAFWQEGYKIIVEALLGFRGDGDASSHQDSDECAEQGFATAACVVHELEEAEVIRQLVLRNTPVRSQPRA